MKNKVLSLLVICFFCIVAMGCSSHHREKPLKIGIAFGGGGAKGAAEVGVIKVLDELGIKADYVAGTSMGAVIGGLYAAGYSGNEIEQMLLHEEWMVIYDKDKMLQNSDARNFLGLIKGPFFREQLDSVLSAKGAHFFQHIQIPFCCVATDLSHSAFKEVDLTEGVVADAIRISMAYPVPSNAPIERNGMKLADGGIVNNLPVDVVRKMGADIVIAIDLEQSNSDYDLGIPTIDLLTEWFNTRPDIPRKLKNIDDADIYIHPSLKGYSITDFSPLSLRHMVECGEKAALEQKDLLLKYKKK